MDSKLSVQRHNGGVSKPPVHHHGRRGGRQQGGGKGIKVVYISSPVMLTASAEEFRAVVQELTGRDSNVADRALDLAHAGGAPSSSSNNSWSSSSSYYSFGRASPTTMTATGTRALSMATPIAGPGRPAEYAAGLAGPPSVQFQGMYDQTGSLLYGQDYW